MKRKPHQAAILAALSVAAVGGAFAANSPDNDALGIADAKTSLTQAIAAAERQVGGKVSRADYERHQDQWTFDVEVVNGTKVMDVKVDPSTGKVLAATEDQADHEDQEDQNEHEEGQDRVD
jgi:uncharacterized membrane protein YkoI